MLIDLFFANPYFNIIFSVFAFFTLILLIYYWIVFSKLAFYKKKQVQNSYQPVSVVICAKNEYYNLKRNLPLVLEQDYPDFEVIVVNDCSDDDTNYLLKDLSEKYPNLKDVSITSSINFFLGKKFPLSVGIKSAKNELLILTDADCRPKSNQWIQEIQNNYSPQTEIVLGYGQYETQKGLLNKLIRFDTIQIAMQYFSLALMNLTYMGVGRNLSYKKSVFFKNKGFTSHYHINSGDDDLFIKRIAKKGNTSIEISEKTHTVSIPKQSFSAWFKQKKRHLSTSIYYKAKHKIILGLYSFSSFVFYLSLFLLIGLSYKNLYTLILIGSLFVIKVLSQLIIFKKCMNRLNEKKLLLLSPIFEFVLIIINMFLGFSNFIFKENKWK
ncbi:MAG: glycosyltransferase [Bacteroidetes bacterium]|nr:glycosyltransferase [Bacteroidota bacterium]